MNTQEAAALLGCSRSHVRWLCRNNKIPHRLQNQPNGVSEYWIELEDCIKYRDTPQKAGRKRGPLENKNGSD